MSTGTQAQPRTIAKFLASSASNYPAVRSCWYAQDGDELRLWLFTNPANAEEEIRVHELQLTLLDRFPAQLIDLDIVNMRYLASSEEQSILPRNARRVAIPGR